MVSNSRDRLLADMRDLQVWLEHAYPSTGRLAIRRAAMPADPGEVWLAHAPPEARTQVHIALAALGWHAPKGPGRHDDLFWLDAPSTSGLSSHERMRAIRRIQSLLALGGDVGR